MCHALVHAARNAWRDQCARAEHCVWIEGACKCRCALTVCAVQRAYILQEHHAVHTLLGVWFLSDLCDGAAGVQSTCDGRVGLLQHNVPEAKWDTAPLFTCAVLSPVIYLRGAVVKRSQRLKLSCLSTKRSG
jgi:hypothetical protein